VLGECATYDEAIARLKASAHAWRKDLTSLKGQVGAFLLEGFRQQESHVVWTHQRVEVRNTGDAWRVLIWAEQETEAHL
jgi:hypothetical protein